MELDVVLVVWALLVSIVNVRRRARSAPGLFLVPKAAASKLTPALVVVALAGTLVPFHAQAESKMLSGTRLAAVKARVAADLLDPGSANFKNVAHFPATGATCGMVNAKNTYGGYTGFKPFYFLGSGETMFPPTELPSHKAALYATDAGAAVALSEFRLEWLKHWGELCPY
jgi:hypothetical protein